MPTSDLVTTMTKRGLSALHVANELREDILSLVLAPNTVIDELALARRFNVSRSPIREALIRLECEGLVHTLPNKGTTVAALTVEDLLGLIDSVELIQRATFRLAGHRAQEETISALSATQALLEASIASDERVELATHHSAFHQLLAESSGNPYLSASLKYNLAQIRRVVGSILESRDNFFTVEIASLHTQILDALKHRNENELENMARNHASLIDRSICQMVSLRSCKTVNLPTLRQQARSGIVGGYELSN